MAKLLTLLTCQRSKFEWTPVHHTAFLDAKKCSYASTYLGATLIQQNDTQMHQIMHVEHNYHKTMIKWNFQ